jgi:hypothetical protein
LEGFGVLGQVKVTGFGLEESSCLRVAHKDTTCKVLQILHRLARYPLSILYTVSTKERNGVEVLEMYLQDD